MKYICEDNRRHSPPSVMVDKVYGKENTKYSCGNSRLKKVIFETLSSTDEEIIVYIDLVPGNLYTITLFIDLLLEFADFGNVYIVPILSSESCIVRSLVSLGYEVPKVQLDIIEGNICILSTKYKNEKTLEKVTKQFYKDIPVISDSLDYYFKDDVVSLEEKGVNFIVNHMCYISNNIIEKYVNGFSTNLHSYINEYITYFNKLSNVNGYPLFPYDTVEDIYRLNNISKEG